MDSLLLRQSTDACTVENTEQRSKPTTGESGQVELAAYANRQYRRASLLSVYTNTSILVVSGPLDLLIDMPNKIPTNGRSLVATWNQHHIVELFRRLAIAIDIKLVSIVRTLILIKHFNDANDYDDS